MMPRLALFLSMFFVVVALPAQELLPDSSTPRYASAGFLYLEDHRIRYEILIPLRDLASIYPIETGADGSWPPALQQTHRAAITALLEGAMSLAIKGRPAAPQQSNLVFLDLRAPMQSTTPAAGSPQGATYHPDTGAVGIILYYAPPSGRPYEVDVAWSGFTPVIQQLPIRIFSRAEESTRVLTQRQNRFLAHHAGPDAAHIEPATGISASHPLRDPQEVREVLHAILRNIYGAFDYSRDEDIYDALERAVVGDLLSRIYLDIRASLYMEQEGGATARVEDIRVTELDILESTSHTTTIRSTWRITGTLEHWGHIHQRTNEYAARIVVRTEEGLHKMASLQIERHRRLADEYSERSSAP